MGNGVVNECHNTRMTFTLSGVAVFLSVQAG